ncbi:lytic transglycosylase domain-containing protein [Curvivirga aplysinae]|uniref:lytic transglycosylase domain-containing protein n=1 Tax=Curvivirga aplysinae TaxID=2529852 RepID=UPI0012BC739E|nr:lytic transglycosylase domain-containing protein [Curvivirga aplysinae]MTI08909.1 lytic transglycosylase domain-containing protein [Curvivirga aplysinae]
MIFSTGAFTKNIFSSRYIKPLSLCAVIATGLFFPNPTEATSLSKVDLNLYEKAFQAADNNKWDYAFNRARKAENKLPEQVLKWSYYQYRKNKASFKEISDFILTHHDWPGIRTLHRSAENAIKASTPKSDLLEWFRSHDPYTVKGVIHYARALIEDGREEKAKSLIREAWRERDMLPVDEKAILRPYKKWLTKEDHLARLEFLLWKGFTGSATRQSRRVSNDYAKLAQARIKLRRRSGGVDYAIRQVPRHLKDHPGLAYERLRWRLRKGRYEDSLELLRNPEQEKDQAGYWWKQRRKIARWAVREKKFDLAYKIAADHRNTSGYSYADAEWFAGWIALQYLHKPKDALLHFQNMERKVSFPVSLSRATYWIGRAYEALGNQDKALESYKNAATFSHRFYGQLAIGKLPKDSQIPKIAPKYAPQEFAVQPDVTHNELAEAIVIMDQLDEDKIVKRFTQALMWQADEEDEFQFIAALNKSIGRNDLAVYTARQADKKHVTLYEDGYPIFPVEGENFLHSPIVHSIIKQESAFYPKAKSSAGALGMMQLMPATAKRQAKRVSLKYNKKRLTTDPLYNITIGQSYLSGLIQRFDGSLPMAFAGYNAGPSRVKRWVNQNGDPRVTIEEMIDWIEMIPFEETRNYVQRVSENLLVYKQKFGEPSRELTLDMLNHVVDPTLSN